MKESRDMNREQTLCRRIKLLTWFFIIGLVISGATAIPLNWELDLLTKWFGIGDQTSTTANSELGRWLLTAREALQDVGAKHPLLFYGTDWLAFGHFVIAIAFVGALRDSIRNRWLFDFGLIACVLVVPYALLFGTIRGIPFWWRLIDCSFGVFGFIPLWFCRKWVNELARLEVSSS
jgi:hypothetical protein